MADQTEISRMRMPVTDAKIIKNNYTYLQENIDALDLVDYLWQWIIIDQSDREQVEAETVTRHRNKKLLDILLKRGPRAYNTFISALRNTGYQDAVIQMYTSALNEWQRNLVANQVQLDESFKIQSKQDSTIIQQGHVILEREDTILKQHVEIKQLRKTIKRQQQEIEKLTHNIDTLEVEREKMNLDLKCRDDKLDKHLQSYVQFRRDMLMFKSSVEKKRKKCVIM